LLCKKNLKMSLFNTGDIEQQNKWSQMDKLHVLLESEDDIDFSDSSQNNELYNDIISSDFIRTRIQNTNNNINNPNKIHIIPHKSLLDINDNKNTHNNSVNSGDTIMDDIHIHNNTNNIDSNNNMDITTDNDINNNNDKYNKESINKIKFPCSKCDKSYSSKGNLMRHFRKIHEKNKNSKRSKRSKRRKSKRKRTKDIISTNSDNESNESTKNNIVSPPKRKKRKIKINKIPSKKKEKKTKSKKIDNNNINDIKWPCNVKGCQSVLSTQSNLIRHKENVHNIKKKYKCKHCKRKFQYQEERSEHMNKKHEGYKQK